MTKDAQATVTVGGVTFGNGRPFALIAGPCAMESRDHALEMAAALKEIADRLGIGLVYKSSFDKANRTSAASARGIGLDKALSIFTEVKERFGLPVLTDVHETEQCAPVAEIVDVLQIPAFLCRQTDLLVAAAKTGRAVNVKKGQFLAPWDMENVARKVTGGRQPERPRHRARRELRLQHPRLRHARSADHGRDDRRAGDLRCHPFGAAAGRAGRRPRAAARVRPGPRPGGGGGRRRRPLHRDAPGSRPAPSDGPNMVPLKEMEALLRRLMRLDAVAKADSASAT